jgi:hypothetical protein
MTKKIPAALEEGFGIMFHIPSSWNEDGFGRIFRVSQCFHRRQKIYYSISFLYNKPGEKSKTNCAILRNNCFNYLESLKQNIHLMTQSI